VTQFEDSKMERNRVLLSSAKRLSREFERFAFTRRSEFEEIAKQYSDATGLDVPFTLNMFLCADIHSIFLLLAKFTSPPSDALTVLSFEIERALDPDDFEGINYETYRRSSDRGTEDVSPFTTIQFLFRFDMGSATHSAIECANLFLSYAAAIKAHDVQLAGSELLRKYVDGLNELIEIVMRHRHESHDSQVTGDAPSNIDAYALLGVTYQASAEEIKTAWRNKVREWHPDKLENMAPELKAFATENLKKINAAYDELMSPKRQRPVADTYQEQPVPSYQSQRASTSRAKPGQKPPNNHGATNERQNSTDDRQTSPTRESATNQSTVWRYAKVFFRTTWRLFKIYLTLIFAILILLAIAVAILQYWQNKSKSDKSLLAAFKHFTAILYLSEVLGMPMLVVEGFIALASGAFLVFLFASRAILLVCAEYPTATLIFKILVVLLVSVWAFAKEHAAEFSPPVDDDPPSTASWVMGLAVIVIAPIAFLSLRSYLPATPEAETDISSSQSGEPAPSPSPNDPVRMYANTSTQQAEESEASVLPTVLDPGIETALQHFAAVMMTNDPGLIADCYAPVVDHYFLKRNVTREDVREYLRVWNESKSEQISFYQLGKVTIEAETIGEVKLDLVKDITSTQNSVTTRQLVHSRLVLRKIDDEWKITSDQDFKE
jgi:hypothetical protein